MFRFPISAVHFDVMSRFALGETIDIKRKDAHLIVDLFFQDESIDEWVDGEGKLHRVLGLYDDLLAEDYRPLFLAWLQATLLEYGWEPNAVLPPVPPGLRKLSDPLRAFSELFEINSDLVAAAASFSDPIRQESNEDLAHALESMPAVRQADILRRMVLGEPPSVVILELRRQLRNSARSAKSSIAAPLPPPASAGALFAKAQRIQLDRERKATEREAALERRRLDLTRGLMGQPRMASGGKGINTSFPA